MKVPKILLMTYSTYLISGLFIVLFNKVIKIKASGHACGVVGPIALLVYVLGYYALFGIIVVVLVYWSSLRMKRHKWSELIIGSIIPVISLFLSILVIGLF